MPKTWILVTLVLLVSSLGFTSSCSFLQNDSQTRQYNDLVSKYNSLLQQNSDLTQQHNDLVEKDNNLILRYEGAAVPPYVTMNGRKATYTVRNLENNIESWTWDVDTLEANTLTGTFMRNLEISQLNLLGLNSIAQRFTNGSKSLSLGGRFACVDLRPYIVKENFVNIASAMYSRHSDDESRIKEVWNMVTQVCSYVGELKDTPRLPLETLLFGGGDCEDVAVLTASILKAMSSSWSVQLVYMDADNPTSFQTMNHVTVFVDTGTFKTFVESTEGRVMNPYQTVDGFYITVP